MEKNENSYIRSSTPITGGYMRMINQNKHLTSGLDKALRKEDDAFTYRPSPEAIKQQKLDELYEDLNRQTKRDIEWNAAKTEMEKINLLYQEMQSINKNLFNISKMLIEKM